MPLKSVTNVVKFTSHIELHIVELDWTMLEDRRNDITLTILYKIINENVLDKEILIPADTRIRSKCGHKFRIMTNNTN